MASSENKLDNICRLCAVETENGVIIYSSEGQHLCLEEKIVQCLRIKVSKDDLLPKMVCCPCKVLLERTHCFAERAIKVQHTLKLLVQMNPMRKHISPNINVKLEEEIDIKDEEGRSPAATTVKSDSKERILSGTIAHAHNWYIQAGIPSSLSENRTQGGLKCEVTLEASGKESNTKNQLPQKYDSYILKHEYISSHSSSSPVSSYKEETVENPEQEGKDEEEYVKNEDEAENDDEIDTRSISELKKKYEKYKLNDDREDVSELEDLRREDDDDEEEERESHEGSQEEWKTHGGIKCNRCDQIFPFRSQFDKHYQHSYNRQPIYTCSYCCKTMEKYSTFRSHCYRHVTEGRYRCEYCEKGFSLKSMLHVHVLAKHTTVKPFICEECGKGFVTRPGLNIHLKKHKSDEKLEYPCLDCGKILHTRGGLTAHQNVHKLGRRFMCDVCGKTFTQKVNMQQHVKHHTGERPFACEKCGKCFAEKSHLNRHYSFHSEKRPFQCTVCQKHYKTERCLKVHAMVHADARPFVCSFCNKGFLSTTKLKQHLNIHTGERPYACKFCERTFTNYPNWLKHTKRRHKEHMGQGPTSNLQQQSVDSNSAAQPQQHIIGHTSSISHETEQSLLPDISAQPSGACVISAISSRNVMHQDSQISNLVQSNAVDPIAVSRPVNHDTLHQPDFSLSQAYSDHIMSMHVSHPHGILHL